MIEEVLRAFTYVKVAIHKCKNTYLQAKGMNLKSYFSKSKEVLSTKCTQSIKSTRSAVEWPLD